MKNLWNIKTKKWYQEILQQQGGKFKKSSRFRKIISQLTLRMRVINLKFKNKYNKKIII
jgi:hypothetical protein